MKNVLICFSLFVFFACGGEQNTPTAAPVSANLVGFTVVDVPGTNAQQATKVGTNDGAVQETGMLLDNKKFGSWNTYYGDGKMKTMTNYTNGLKNGFHLEFNDRGQVSVHQNYLDDQLHGRQVKYAFGSRIEEESHYNRGQLDGVYKTYFKTKPGQVQKEIHYKNNQQHGKFVQYSEDGKILLEYEYKDGKKVSGGVK